MTDHESLLKASAELRDDVSLVLVQDNEVRCYRGDGIGPIIDAGGEKLHRLANAAVADRVIGKACPVLFVLGEQDQMTPPKAAQSLINAARSAGKTTQIKVIAHGHNQMSESPDATLFAIRDFLQ